MHIDIFILTFAIIRKLAGILVGIAIGCCVLIGVVTFYAARADAPTIDNSEPTAEPEPTAAAAAGKHKKVTDVRLPRHLSPELYTLQLVPFIVPDNFTIRGHVEIQMHCNEASNNVTLHVADILVENSTVALKEMETGREIQITGHDYDKDREFYISKLGEMLQPGKMYSIKIAYTAYLKDNLKGFYRSVYKNQLTGKDEYIAVTQFQATDARRAFPCFDEPGIKAAYHVSLGRLKTMSSISNMPIEKKGEAMEGTDEYVWDRYQKSVKMSTYLVAFVVSKFKFKETETTGTPPVSCPSLPLAMSFARCASAYGRSPPRSTRPSMLGISDPKSSSSLRTTSAFPSPCPSRT